MDPAAAFLHRLTEKHDVCAAVFFADGYGPLSVSRLDLHDRLDIPLETISERSRFE
jgi:putative transposase